jgi:hypothetical protein
MAQHKTSKEPALGMQEHSLLKQISGSEATKGCINCDILSQGSFVQRARHGKPLKRLDARRFGNAPMDCRMFAA